MPTVSPFLWFTKDAEGALELYTEAFADSEVVGVERAPMEGHDQFMAATLRIGATELVSFNGGPYAECSLNPAISLSVVCEDREEVNRHWFALGERGFRTVRLVARSLRSLGRSSRGTVLRDQVSVGFIAVRMVDEYAWHWGHADSLREAIDGTEGHRGIEASKFTFPASGTLASVLAGHVTARLSSAS